MNNYYAFLVKPETKLRARFSENCGCELSEDEGISWRFAYSSIDELVKQGWTLQSTKTMHEG